MFKGSLVALITPFDKNNQIDEEAFLRLIDWHIEEKTDGLILCGTTGEAPTLSKKEKKRLLTLAKEQCKDKIALIMGTGSYHTDETLEETLQAKDYGVDACLIIVPYYNRPSNNGLIQHFAKVASAGVPLIIYHHPGRTGLFLDIQTLKTLCLLENVVAVKECSNNMEYTLELSSVTTVLSGDDTLLIPMTASGAKGIISVMANILPREIKQMSEHCLNGNFQAALALTKPLLPLMKGILKENNPQGIKYAASLMGKCENLFRLPLTSPEESSKQAIESLLNSFSLSASR